MFCPWHPTVQMTETGRKSSGRGGDPVLQCPVCVETIRAKLAPLLGEKGWKHKPPAGPQIILPSVRMPWY